jgi:predicted transposase YbfD/YdcC
MDVLTDKPHRRSLLDHFSAVPDPRQAWRVAHPLPEVLLLVVCGTIAANDDYDDIVDWGEAHLSFLRRFSAFHFGLPCADWLRTLMNRIDPDLFSACFLSWVREWWPEVPDLIALDGKTSRRSYDRKAGRKALHLVSAFATNERLVLGQEACAEKSNETTAIPALLARLAAGGHLKGALVSIDAVACNPDMAQAVVDGGAEYLLAVKANQPTLHDEVVAFFDTAQAEDVEAVVEVDKDHGRIETRRCVVSRQIDWLTGERRFPGESRFAKLTVVAMTVVAMTVVAMTVVAMVEARIELPDRCTVERRFYISSAPLSAARCAQAVRAHWRIETSLHWVLDVLFGEDHSLGEDHSRLRKGHGAQNGAWSPERGMEPRTWRSCATSLSTSCGRPAINGASSGAANAPDGIPNILLNSSGCRPVNPDSLPCRRAGAR